MLPKGKGWLLAEFGADTKRDADAKQGAPSWRRCEKGAGYCGEKLYDDPAAEKRIWDVRESGAWGQPAVRARKCRHLRGSWEDSAVPPENLSGYLRDLRALFDRYDYGGSLYGHFGQGCVHTRINWDPHTADGLTKWRRFIDEASDLVLSYGGSVSGEHGDGQSRGELLEKMYGAEVVQAFREFKAVWDPAGKMNPGKVVDPYPITSNLRLGPHYAPIPVRTHFSYPKDAGNAAHAATRCVGVGQVSPAMGTGTMCPSFMVTHEEKHSTQGSGSHPARDDAGATPRSSCGAPTRSEGRPEAVPVVQGESCKSDCPVNVDMATYKAEFLSHHYRHRLRPRVAYAMGLIYWWARAASRVPRLANAVTHAPILSRGVKWAGGIAPQRSAPRFAPQTFAAWFAARPQRAGAARPQVIVWPDTFSNYLDPSAAIAAVEVLEAAGFDVAIPSRPLCCGRPLYDYGMLDTAEHLLRPVLAELRPVIRAGVPVVGIEPSCLAVFRDELPELMPDDLDAGRLAAQSFTLSRVPAGPCRRLAAARAPTAGLWSTATVTTRR